MIDNTDLNELLTVKAINGRSNSDIELLRISFERSWIKKGISMKYFTWVAGENRYIILDEDSYKYRLSIEQHNKLLELISISWSLCLSNYNKKNNQHCEILNNVYLKCLNESKGQ